MSLIKSNSVIGSASVVMLLSPIIVPVGIKKIADFIFPKHETKQITVKRIYTNIEPHVVINKDDDCYFVSKTIWEHALKNAVDKSYPDSYGIVYNVNNKHIEHIYNYMDWDSVNKSLDGVRELFEKN